MNKEQRSELEELSKSVLVHWNAFWSILQDDAATRSAYQKFDRVVHEAIESGKLGKLRAISREFKTWLREWPPENARRVQEMVGLEIPSVQLSRQGGGLRTVIDAGIIRTRDEYEEVMSYLNDVSSPMTAEERSKVNSLVMTYESKRQQAKNKKPKSRPSP